MSFVTPSWPRFQKLQAERHAWGGFQGKLVAPGWAPESKRPLETLLLADSSDFMHR